jgi:hypothetical protein
MPTPLLLRSRARGSHTPRDRRHPGAAGKADTHRSCRPDGNMATGLPGVARHPFGGLPDIHSRASGRNGDGARLRRPSCQADHARMEPMSVWNPFGGLPDIHSRASGRNGDGARLRRPSCQADHARMEPMSVWNPLGVWNPGSGFLNQPEDITVDLLGVASAPTRRECLDEKRMVERQRQASKGREIIRNPPIRSQHAPGCLFSIEICSEAMRGLSIEVREVEIAPASL